MKNLKLLLASLSVILLVTSCTEDMIDTYEDITPAKKSLKGDAIFLSSEAITSDYWPSDISCVNNYTLIGGQTITMGSVVVGEIGNDLYVKYVADTDYLLIETHMYIGDVAKVLDKKGGPKIGHFPYATESSEGSQVVIYKISKDYIEYNSDGGDYEDGDCFEIALHSVIVCAENESPSYDYDAEGNMLGYTCEETAWGKQSGNVFVIKSLMDSPDGSTPAIAATENSDDGIIFNIQDVIGMSVGMIAFYDFVTEIGQVSVEKDEDVIRFIVTSDYGKVYWSRLFVGSLEQLESIGIWSSRAYPYSLYSDKDEIGNYIGDEQQVFEFPTSILGSGNEMSFDGPRWGYFVEYCPC